MSTPLDVRAAEYSPSFAVTMKKTAAAAPPRLPAPAKSKISVTRTGVNTTYPMPPPPMPEKNYAPFFAAGCQTFAASKAWMPPLQPASPLPPMHSAPPTASVVSNSIPPSSPATAPGERSPAVAARSVPTRFSPATVPRHHMNPNATEFMPGRRNGPDGGLEALPTSTADMELAKTPAGAAAAAVHAPSLPGAARRSLQNSPIIQPSRLSAKSASEIEAISKNSALNAAAAAYVPQRTLARVVLTQPSPLALAPSEDPAKDNIEMMLDDLWCLFYLPTTLGENIKEEDYNPTLVFRVDSILTFWRVVNNIAAPSELQLSTLYLFRDGIDPKWEDPANRDGGIVKVKATAAQVDEAWELLLCRTIGDSWSPSVRETVNGVVLKVRERAYWLELWVTKNSSALQKDLAELWHPILGASFATTYLTHAMMQERSHAAAALAAEKQKKNRRRY
ncbi:Eukaryotic initiation factor 4E family protein [Leishmania donovani]|uniref:Eukaryotic initiation factor 4E family protein n=1 Tax=Leishmania donovani TaxID=5661 RepID=A0A3Q8IEL7_LEIDO|nr:eukaryotic translation initiation factor 4E, putative [Leishmania donovani]TPP45618.1 Eukaryotic initiation factor 4E family protein [Leishmania donovani]